MMTRPNNATNIYGRLHCIKSDYQRHVKTYRNIERYHSVPPTAKHSSRNRFTWNPDNSIIRHNKENELEKVLLDPINIHIEVNELPPIYHQLLLPEQFPRRKHHVTKNSGWEAKTPWKFQKHDPKWVNNSFTSKKKK